MRIVLYAHHSLFEPALSLTDALARRAEVHLVLEVPAGAWQAANFTAPADLAPGVVPGDAALSGHVPERTRALWRRARSFHLVVTGPERARHPRSVRLMRQALALVRSLDPDVLHVDDVDVSPRLALALAATRLPFPVVVGCHDPEPHSGETDWRVKSLTRTLMFTRSDAVVVHHEAGAVALQQRHPRLRAPVGVVHLAPYDFLRGGAPVAVPDAATPTVLLLGRITPYKGVAALFGAAEHVARVVPGLRVVVAGRPENGYEPPPAPLLANGGAVETAYRYLPNEEVADLVGRAHVVVCPYTDASQSGVVLTAFGFGRPVVVTDVGGLREYVQDGVDGLVVPAADERALATAIVRCLTEPGLLARLAAGVAAGRGWAQVASEMLDVYAGVVSGRAAGTRGVRGRVRPDRTT